MTDPSVYDSQCQDPMDFADFAVQIQRRTYVDELEKLDQLET